MALSSTTPYRSSRRSRDGYESIHFFDEINYDISSFASVSHRQAAWVTADRYPATAAET
jgi:hypothetical protein